MTYGLADAESAAEYLVLLKETKYKGRYSTIGQTASYLHEDDPLSASVFRDSILVIFGRNETGEKMSYRAEVGNFSFEHHDLDEYILDLYLGIDNELPVDIQIS